MPYHALIGVGWPIELLRISASNWKTLSFSIWWPLWLVAFLLVLLVSLRGSRPTRHEVQLNINLGGIGAVSIKPNWEDIQVAHKIWTELKTRKAAIPIDPELDVIAEIYDSWYALFGRVRQLLSEIPSQCIRNSASTRTIVRVATDTLNLGLRPHLTTWQARFRNWWKQNQDRLATMTPQQLQCEFPNYEELTNDLQKVNQQLIEYADELKKVIYGK